MIRVLHVTNAYPSSARPIKGIFIKEQIEHLSSLDGFTIESYVLEDDVPPIRRYVKAWSRLRKVAAGYHVVHAHHVFCGLLCILAGLGPRLVVSFMNDIGCNVIGVPKRLSLWLERLTHGLSSVSIFKSPKFAPWLRRFDAIIPNGVAVPFVPTVESAAVARSRLEVCGNDMALLFVSANDLHRASKRYDRFVQVAACLRGRGYKLKELLMVNIARTQIDDYFAAANVMVVVSEFEGSPNSVKEALARGLPVVSTDVGDVRLLARGVPGALVLSEFDVERFADAVIEAAFDPASRAVRSETFFRNCPTPSQAADRIARIYRSVSARA